MSAETRPLTPAEQLRWTNIGVLAALALLLGYAETFVPIPIPGIKLGLANIPVLVCLARHDVSGACCIAAIKVLASGLLFGSPITMLYAGAGTALALAGMVPLSRLRTMRLWMVSVVGALLHVAGQLMVASLLLGSSVVWYASPLLLTAACVTGVLCGLLATNLATSLPAHANAAADNVEPVVARKPRTRTIVASLALVVFTVVILHLSDPVTLFACTAAMLVCCAATRVPLRRLLGAIRPLTAILVLTFAMQYVISPQTAPQEALHAVLRLAAIAAASTAFMQIVPTNDPAPSIAWLVLPLTRLGVQTQGFIWAISIAIQLVPELSSTLHNELAHIQGRPTLRQIQEMLPRILQSLYDCV